MLAMHVFRKEAREMFRDKRVRSSALFGPFILVFMLLFLFGTIAESMSKPSSLKLHVVRPKSDNPLVNDLRKDRVNVVEVSSLEAGRKLVAAGEAALVLHFEDDYAERVASGQPTSITAVYDSKEQRSQIALSAIERGIARTNQQAVEQILESRGVPKAMAAPVHLNKQDATQAKGASDLLTSILPYLIVVWAFFGGMTSAADLVAGEKERTTLETLLISPVSRSQIVFGKFLALALICLLSSLSSLVAVAAIGILPVPSSEVLFKEGLGISPVVLGAIVAVLLPTVAFFASTLVAISSFAKNTREAQTYLGLASFVVMMPAIFSQFIGFTDFATARWVSLVPVLNTATSIRSALLGKLDALSFLATIGVGVALAGISIFVATRLFNREQVLTRV